MNINSQLNMLTVLLFFCMLGQTVEMRTLDADKSASLYSKCAFLTPESKVYM